MNSLITSLRERIGLSKKEMAQWLQITRSGLHNYETGRRSPRPYIAHRIIGLAKLYGINLTLEDIYPKN